MLHHLYGCEMTKLDARKGIVTLSEVIDCRRGTATDQFDADNS
jgi:hypothetical protein